MDLVEQFIARYRREFDFYDQAGRLVAQQLDNRLQASGIRTIVTSRAKNPKRLANKVSQRDSKHRYSSVEEIYEDIVDLAGVRVALYFPGERTEIDKLIKEQFSLMTPPKEFVGTSNPSYEKRFSGYWATHYRVQLRETSLHDIQQRYVDARIEIQVASVLMHAWAEVEHDLVYKPLQDSLSYEELAILDELNGLVLTGEIALERLQKAIEVRVAHRGTPLNNHYELASFLLEIAKPLLKGAGEPVLGEVDVLFALLKKLELNSPEALKDYVSTLHPDTERRPIAQQIIDQILAADSTRYDAYAEIQAVREQPSLFTSKEQDAITLQSQQDLGYFMSQWITFERFLRELSQARKLDPRSMGIPSTKVLRELDVLDQTTIREVEKIRRLRNDLVHGIEVSDPTYIKEAGQTIENIILKLQEGPREDVRAAAQVASLNNLAGLYYKQGRYEQAEPLYKKALAIREKVLGPEHPDVATSLNNLAALYRSQGHYQQAEPLYERALAIREKVLGPEHPDTANSLNNLASLYYIQEHYEQAEPLYERALAIREKVLGPEHSDTATSLNNLAALYRSQEHYQQAEPLYERALAIREKVLGPEHPDVANSLSGLAELYKNQGHYEQADLLYKRALAIREKVLGLEHPDVANSLSGLAELYKDQGHYEQADPLYKRALAIQEKILGPKHPNIITVQKNYTDFLRRKKKRRKGSDSAY